MSKLRIVCALLMALLICSSCGNRTRVRREQGYPNQKQEQLASNRKPRQKSRKTSPRNKRTNAIENRSGISNSQNTQKLTGTQIFEKYNSAVFMIYTSDGWNNYQGSGFFVDPSGIGISNYHVFDDTYKGMEKIKLTNGSVYKIEKVIAYDDEDDFIVFKVDADGEKFNYIPVADKSPKVGEKAFAIGSPRGFENTFSSGEISQLREDNWIQISVPIDHGSSGGVLMNEYGEAIGITSSGLDNSGANLNFAKDISVVKPYI